MFSVKEDNGRKIHPSFRFGSFWAEKIPGVKSMKFNSENAVKFADWLSPSFAFYGIQEGGGEGSAPDISVYKSWAGSHWYHWNRFLNYTDKNCELLLLN